MNRYSLAHKGLSHRALLCIKQVILSTHRLRLLPRQVINQYLVAKYKGQGPDLLPAEPELAAKAWLIARIHDLYITPIQVRLQPPCSAGCRPLLLCCCGESVCM